MAASCHNSKNSEAHESCGSDFCTPTAGTYLNQLSQTEITDSTITFSVKFILLCHCSELTSAYLQEKINQANEVFSAANIAFRMQPEILKIYKDYDLDFIYRYSALTEVFIPELKNKNQLLVVIAKHGKYLNGFTKVLTEQFENYPKTNYHTLFLSNEAIFNSSTLPHELGHFFGLQHTFGESIEENSTDETIIGDNCDHAGDYICDTPADPNRAIKTCQNQSTELHPFKPDINNFMSYYPNPCKNRFSQNQAKLMHHFALQYRGYLAVK
jgi:hypothetical protein